MTTNVTTNVNTQTEPLSASHLSRPFISPWWSVYILLVVGLPLFSYLTYHPKPEQYGVVAPFVLKTQAGENFMLGSDERPIIVNFIFTRCTTICSTLTTKMATLQERIPSDEALFLSISVDPNYDQPDILRKYGEQFDADFSRWHFLTGDEKKIQTIIASFQQYYEVLNPTDDQPNIAHSEKFILLDQYGHIRGFFDDDPEGLNRLVKDLKAL